MGVSQPNAETTPLHLSFQVKHAKHLHAIRGDGILFSNYPDVAKLRVAMSASTIS